MTELRAQTDWRARRNRREGFLRSYLHSLRYRNFPGCVYFVLPYMAQQLNWDTEQRYWAAWLNANTQNPVTTLLLMEQGSRPAEWEKVARWQASRWHELAWDTDRKYFKSSPVFTKALAGYAEIMSSAGSQSAYWKGCTSWETAWIAMRALPYMGRLSAWSGLEYVRLLGDTRIPDASTLLLDDASGSRSHRNGLALVTGNDDMLHDSQLNPGYTEKWDPGFVAQLADAGERLLSEAACRSSSGYPVCYLTLESALCTWKSWHKKSRRYPNVYSDMLYDRLRWAERYHGDRFGVIWDARKAALPDHLRLEAMPGDPGLKPVKQNHYRETGQVPLLGHEPEWADMWSDFDEAVKNGTLGVFR
jgi:Alpha-glutamyl/putrescinyl thymine pyrophosphorylase clade 2